MPGELIKCFVRKMKVDAVRKPYPNKSTSADLTVRSAAMSIECPDARLKEISVIPVRGGTTSLSSVIKRLSSKTSR